MIVEMKPKFKIELPGTEWCLVITSTGNRFYHNSRTKESVWNYPNDQVGELVHNLNKNELLVTIAKARGLHVHDPTKKSIQGKKDARKEELLESLKTITNKKVDDNKNNESAVSKSITVEGTADNNRDTSQRDLGQNEGKESQKSAMPALLTGYASSDGDSDSDKESEAEEASVPKAQKHQVLKPAERPIEESESSEYETDSDDDENQEDSDAENGINLNELDQFASSDEEDDNAKSDSAKIDKSSSSVQQFIQLMEENELDPYGAWDSESKKIISDARFVAIELDEDRKRIFDNWSTFKAKGDIQINPDQEINDSEDLENGVKYSDGDLEAGPTKLQYVDVAGLDLLKFTPSFEDNPVLLYFEFLTKTFKPNKLYLDFKRKYRTNSDFKDIELTDKNKERLYLEFANLKKKPIPERRDILSNFLVNSKVFLASIKNKTDPALAGKLLDKLKTEFLQPDEKLKLLPIDNAKILLKHIEELLEVPKSVMENTIYFAVPTKDRIQVLYDVYTILLHK